LKAKARGSGYVLFIVDKASMPAAHSRRGEGAASRAAAEKRPC